ncbi:hypothetical protein GJAV_G00061180 [Gymnothorax javanicus]|nr:hypothetical protein GJAV_G00061180 [Gymnothorax javanicus]
MPLRFRSVVPYTLPGVLALIGWWWYISRKKGRIAGHDAAERAVPAPSGLLPSPMEGSNGTAERGSHRKPSRGRCRVQEEPMLVQEVTSLGHEVTALGPEVVAEVHAPVCAAVERAAVLESSPCSAAIELGRVQDPGQRVAPVSTETPEGSQAPLRSEDKDTSAEELSVSAERAVVMAAVESHVPRVAVPGHIRDTTPKVEVEQSKLPPPPQMPDAAQTNAVRPEPEGEVAADRTAVPCDDTSKQSPVVTEMPLTLATATMTAVATLPSERGRPGPVPENGEAERPGSAGEIERLAAGLISEVILAATQEVLTVSRGDSGEGVVASSQCQRDEDEEEGGRGHVWEPSSSTPVTNGRLCATRDPPAEDSPALKGLSEFRVEEGVSLSSTTSASVERRLSSSGGEELNGCLSAVMWEEPAACPALCQTMPASLNRLRAKEGTGAAEDSGCSTCQSEDGVSSEDLLHSTALSCAPPARMGDLLHDSGISRGPADGPERGPGARGLEGAGLPCNGKGLNGAGVGNGTHLASEAEADHSGGSDVNSMDSVDSGCTLGAGDGSSGSTQSSELIIWEIEVPKHLVGRLIGKQGRYVSFLKQSSGAKIYISTLPYTQEFQICHIEGTQQQVDKALALIGKKFKDLDLTNLFAPPSLPLTLPSLPMTSWLLLPNGVTVEVIVVNIVSAGHVFVQQHTHPTYHALRSLDQQMFLCYSQPGTPALPSPAEVGVICAAPAVEGAWWRAQVISFYKDSSEVEIRYVDYGGYDRVKIDTLRQIRSDFVTLPFQGAEVLLDNIAPLPGEERFSAEANAALEEITRGVALLAQVTNYDNNTGLPLVQMWNMVGDELVSVNRTLAERGFGTWVDSF